MHSLTLHHGEEMIVILNKVRISTPRSFFYLFDRSKMSLCLDVINHKHENNLKLKIKPFIMNMPDPNQI